MGKLVRVLMPYPTVDNIPAVSDPRWVEWTAPLYEFLAQPRSWPELTAWRKERKMKGFFLAQLLAWLSFNDRARYEGGAWIAQAPLFLPSVTDRTDSVTMSERSF